MSKEHNNKQPNECLIRLIQEIVDEHLEEQNVLAGGAVQGTSALPLFSNPKNTTGWAKKKKLKEYNAVSAIAGIGGEDSAQSVATNYVSEDDEENLGDKKPSRRRKAKRSAEPSIGVKIMWSGDLKPGTLPKAKFVALESSGHEEPREHSRNSRKIVRITCEKRPSESYLEVLRSFIVFCNKKLQLENIPHIYLHVTKKPYMTTGSYMMENNTIHVLVKNRLLMDVLRTLSHELTHRKQHETGLLEKELSKQDPMDEMGDLNTPYENEAYEKSGNFVKEFARTYKKMPKEELFSLHESIESSLSHLEFTTKCI